MKEIVKIKVLMIAGLTVVLTTYNFSATAQDVRHSQPFTNVLGLNPAMMGPNSDLNVALNYRSQWAAVKDGYKTYNLNVLYPHFLKNGNSKLDFGLGFQNRSQGAFDFMNLNLSVGYKLRLTENGHHLSAAVQGAYLNSALNTSNLIFDDQYNSGSYNPSNASSENIANESVTSADASLGLMWFYNPGPDSGKVHAYFGISLYHLNQPDESFTGSGLGMPIRQSFQTGLKIITDGKIHFSPHIMFNSQGGSEEVAAGLYVDYLINEKFTCTLGGWYRKDNAMTVILGLKFKEYALGYSYDILTSNLNTSVSGLTTHEITLTYGLNLAAKKGLDMGSNPLSYY